MNKQIKTLIKKICSTDNTLLVDHDLNVTVLDSSLKNELNALIKNMSFTELYRVTGYFIDELEGDGLNMDDDEMDNPSAYLAFCLEECDQTLQDVKDYVNDFKSNNLKDYVIQLTRNNSKL